jgi:poly-gamma-glutamate capsule biosynthesis protein CapA/YwtB (metallophosphatase superfamily)
MVKIGFYGDFNIDWPNHNHTKKISTSIADLEVLNYSNSNDFNICNLEGPITESQKKIKKTGLNLKQTSKSIDLLKILKISHVSLANNHIMDYGIDGLKDTLANLKKNKIESAGAGLTHKELLEPIIIKKDDIIIGIICAAEDEFNNFDLFNAGTNKLDIVELNNQIFELKSKVDKLILFLHGGIEHYKYPTIRQKKKYRCLIDLGVDCIIGSHSHCFQGFEKYNKGIIFYSLGNLYFNDRGFPDAKISLGVKLLIGKNTNIDFEMIFLSNSFKNQKLSLLDKNEQFKKMENINEISQNILSDNYLKKSYYNHSTKSLNKTIGLFIPLNKYVLALIKRTNMFKFFVSDTRFLSFLNTIHNETARTILSKNLIRLYKKYYL